MTAIAAMTEADDLAFARLLADAANRISLDLYRDAELLVVTTPDRTEVSEADRAVEAALRRLLRTHRPEQGVLGGERGTGGSRRVRCSTRSTRPATSSREWIGGPPCSPWRSTAASRWL